MNWRLIGFGGAFMAFFAINIFISAFIIQDFLFTTVPGGVAAWYLWKYCMDKETHELEKLLNPPEETWPVSLPVAWGTIRDVLDTSKVHTGAGGTSGWRVQREDDSRGLILAQLTFNEQVGGLNGQVHPRTVEVQALLRPEGSSTIVDTNYRVFSPMNFDRVRTIVSDTQKALTEAAQRNKES